MKFQMFFKWKFYEGGSQYKMEELNSSEAHSVMEVLEGPMIEDTDEKSVGQRIDKAANKATQSDVFSEFDLFSNDISLNLEGQDKVKSEFGGIVYLLIMTTTIALTVIYVFPNGLKINTLITDYSLVRETNGRGVSVFGPSNYLMRLFVMDKTENAQLKGDVLRYLVRNVEAYQTITDTAKGTTTKYKLEITADTEGGSYYLYKTGANSGVQIYNDTTENAKIRIELLKCPYFDVDPTYGMCSGAWSNRFVGVQMPSYNKLTGELQQAKVRVPVSATMDMTSTLVTMGMDVAQYKTNSLALGYIANIFSYQINYFEPWTSMVLNLNEPSPPIFYATFSQDCLDEYNSFYDLWGYRQNTRCTYFDIAYSGTTTYAMEQFDNIIEPLLFFIAVSQTLLFFVGFLFLNNYSNNCLYIAVADKLVYLTDPEGRHYDFKRGAAVFFACMWHRHFLVNMLEYVLYRFWETTSKKWLPAHSQAAMTMIDFGAECMTDQAIYGELNDLYAQENTQPSKIIFDYDADPELKKKQIEEEINEEEPERYFDDEIREEAFRRMCVDHEIYSARRRIHLRDIMLETDKQYKLVLQAQDVFEEYCKQVRNEGFSKEIELPLTFQNEEMSGHNLKKENFY